MIMTEGMDKSGRRFIHNSLQLMLTGKRLQLLHRRKFGKAPEPAPDARRRSLLQQHFGTIVLPEQHPGLAQPPYPGAKGQDLYDNVSKQAWQEWLEHQTRLINEKHLNMMDPSARTYLAEQMEKFFSDEDFDKAEGYVPPKD